MDFQIAWSEPAFDDLEAIVRHLADQDPVAAEELRVELLESVDVLARFPRIGPVYAGDRSGRTREILCRTYRVFYRVDEARRRVEILTLWHGARREPRLPG